MNPTVELLHGAVIVRFKGIMHFRCKRTDIIAVHSWMWNEKHGDPHARFFIEYTTTKGVVLCDYDREEFWITILNGLEEVLK
jgi:hypothetical protein